MPTQPARDRITRSLEELMRVRYRDIFLVHRIDTQTTGVVVFARTRVAAAELSSLFASREVAKTYLAVADRKSTRLNSSHSQISYAVFCLKKKKIKRIV